MTRVVLNTSGYSAGNEPKGFCERRISVGGTRVLPDSRNRRFCAFVSNSEKAELARLKTVLPSPEMALVPE